MSILLSTMPNACPYSVHICHFHSLHSFNRYFGEHTRFIEMCVLLISRLIRTHIFVLVCQTYSAYVCATFFFVSPGRNILLMHAHNMVPFTVTWPIKNTRKMNEKLKWPPFICWTMANLIYMYKYRLCIYARPFSDGSLSLILHLKNIRCV